MQVNSYLCLLAFCKWVLETNFDNKNMETIQIDLDSLKKDTWTEEEHKNAEIVIDFVQNLMNNHNFDYIKKKFGGSRYKQHNQSMIDGLKGVLDVVSNFAMVVIKNLPT